MDPVYKAQLIEAGHDVVELNPERKAQWISDLRSGKYQQGYGMLHYKYYGGADRYCCLGVACRTSGLESDPSGQGHIYHYGGEPSVPPKTVLDWFGFDRFNNTGEFRNTDAVCLAFPKLDSSMEYWELTALNDSGQWTFDEIADLIDYVF